MSTAPISAIIRQRRILAGQFFENGLGSLPSLRGTERPLVNGLAVLRGPGQTAVDADALTRPLASRRLVLHVDELILQRRAAGVDKPESSLVRILSIVENFTASGYHCFAKYFSVLSPKRKSKKRWIHISGRDVAGIQSVSQFPVPYTENTRSSARKRPSPRSCPAILLQRGEAASYDKFYPRGSCGAQRRVSLQTELPLPWSLSSAESFACGGVGLLGAAGVITHSPSAAGSDLSALEKTAAVLDTPEFAEALSANSPAERVCRGARTGSACPSWRARRFDTR